MNSMTTTAPAGQTPAVRTIPEIEADILAQKRTIGASIVFIGRALIEAKGQLSHGEWGRWLAERVEFSASSAENYMRIAREFEGDSALLSLPYSKVLALLPVPREERETFAKENGVEDKSVAQIRQLIRERDEARRKAQADAITASEFRRRSEEAERKIRELENRKPERVEVEVAPEDYKKVMAERHEMEGRVLQAERERDAAYEERDEAEQERDDALEELQAERAAGGAPDPLDVAPFCDACSALLNKLYAAPYAKALLMTKNEVELKHYEMNVRLIMEWALKVQNVIDEVQCEKFGEEAVFQIL